MTAHDDDDTDRAVPEPMGLPALLAGKEIPPNSNGTPLTALKPSILVMHVLIEVSSARTKSGHRGRTSRWSWPHTAANRDLRLPDRMTDAYTS